ncbi:MAG: HEPN domain-containing protein [Halanaerobiales bacterium]|nr:HEPN domain-containing protein [Halanaerobiales bacterium]
MPIDLLNILHELNPLNIATRYPDQEFELMEDFDYDYSAELLNKTRRLFKWIKTNL